MTRTTVAPDTNDGRALATTLVERTVSDTNVQLAGTAVAIGGGYFLSAGHVFFPAHMPDAPKSAQVFTFFVREGLNTGHTTSILAADFPGNIANMGWGENGSDISVIHTDDAAPIDIPMLVYADPDDASGAVTTFGYPSQAQGYDGHTMVQVTGSQSTDSLSIFTLSNGQVMDVLVSDPGAEVVGGQSGSGLWLTNDVDRDGVETSYLAGIVTLDVSSGGEPAIGYEPLSDAYDALTQMIAATGESADDFARATLVSGQSDDSPFTLVLGSLLHEDLIGGDNSDELFGFGGNDELLGRDDDDYLDGGAGDDRIWGHDGDDDLIDGEGKDNLFGGDGEDIFILYADGQADAIKDFEIDEDMIDVSAWGVTEFSELEITTHATGKSILRYGAEATSINDGSWTLSADQFSADNFIFADSSTLMIIEGTDGNDKLFGSDASEDLYDGAGVDNLWGRDGLDIFTMAADGDIDSIKDFQIGLDFIDISAWGATGFDDLTITTHASGKSILQFGNETLSINDGSWTLPASSFSEDDFIFA